MPNKVSGVRLLAAFLFLALSITPSLQAEENIVQSVGDDSMNGYSLSQFPDFEKNWHFVTVRYRDDTKEQRITYANDIAWNALLKGVKDYPDGAVFAKIGIGTTEDQSFASSRVPADGKRFQLMVMDHAKNKATHGWGYALFDLNGKPFPVDHATETQACNACHTLVPERGYVFSQPLRLEVGVPAFTPTAHQAPAIKFAFDTVSVDMLPAALRETLPLAIKRVRRLRGEMETKLFQGTLDEMMPTLSQEAVREKLPAALISKDGKMFMMVFLDIYGDVVPSPPPNQPVSSPPRAMNPCVGANENVGVIMKSIFTEPVNNGKLVVHKGDYCHTHAVN